MTGINKPKRSKWFKVCAALVILLLSIPLLAIMVIYASYRINLYKHEVEVAQHQTIWEEKGIRNYSLTVEILYGPGSPYQLALVVQADSVRSVTDVRSYESIGVNLDNYERYKIDSLFAQAKDCYLVCHVEYDSDYGYPKFIGGGFAESGYVKVIAFQSS